MDACGLGILCCLRRYHQPRNSQPRELPQVQLDTGHMGEWLQHRVICERACLFSHLHIWIYRLSNSIGFVLGNEVVIVKSGKRICGSGAALANAAILQNKCYFEMKIQSGGALLWNVTLRSIYIYSRFLSRKNYIVFILNLHTCPFFPIVSYV